MCWGIIHIKGDRSQDIIEYFNSQEDVEAFMPMIERWFSSSHVKEYQKSYLYPDYVFVRTSMNKDEFHEKYKGVFHSIRRFAKVLEYEDFIALNSQEELFLERMLDDSYMIRHSIGEIINSQLKVEEGPLVGMENQIKKIDRHKRLAILDYHLLGKTMKVPLEVISKS